MTPTRRRRFFARAGPLVQEAPHLPEGRRHLPSERADLRSKSGVARLDQLGGEAREFRPARAGEQLHRFPELRHLVPQPGGPEIKGDRQGATRIGRHDGAIADVQPAVGPLHLLGLRHQPHGVQPPFGVTRDHAHEVPVARLVRPAPQQGEVEVDHEIMVVAHQEIAWRGRASRRLHPGAPVIRQPPRGMRSSSTAAARPAADRHGRPSPP